MAPHNEAVVFRRVFSAEKSLHGFYFPFDPESEQRRPPLWPTTFNRRV